MEKYQINKAYAGISGNRILRLNTRQQWVELPSNPEVYNVDFFSPVLALSGGMGFGIDFVNIGAKSVYGFNYSYNYIYRSGIGDFSAGIGLNYLSFKLKNDKIRTPDGFFENDRYDPDDSYLSGLFGKNLSFIRMNYSFLYLLKNIEIGIEFDKDISGLQKVGISTPDLLRMNFQFQQKLNDLILLRFNLVVFSDFNSFQTETGIIAILKNNYITGINLRGYNKNSFDALGLIGGADISRNLKLVYSYDIGLSGLSEAHNGSHQMTVFFNLGSPERKPKLPNIIFNPRLY
ncbi:MAG: type IX secretion system membrane protein PorP/SprF [Deltaproteobacteria bacterium]